MVYPLHIFRHKNYIRTGLLVETIYGVVTDFKGASPMALTMHDIFEVYIDISFRAALISCTNTNHDFLKNNTCLNSGA